MPYTGKLGTSLSQLGNIELGVTTIFYGAEFADASIVLSGIPIWVSPANGSTVGGNPVLVFTMPTTSKNTHFEIQLDTVNTFDGANFCSYKTTNDQTGWQYWNGLTWVSIPSTGVPSTYAGNQASLTVPSGLSSTTWYRRVRSGV